MGVQNWALFKICLRIVSWTVCTRFGIFHITTLEERKKGRKDLDLGLISSMDQFIVTERFMAIRLSQLEGLVMFLCNALVSLVTLLEVPWLQDSSCCTPSWVPRTGWACCYAPHRWDDPPCPCLGLSESCRWGSAPRTDSCLLFLGSLTPWSTITSSTWASLYPIQATIDCQQRSGIWTAGVFLYIGSFKPSGAWIYALGFSSCSLFGPNFW